MQKPEKTTDKKMANPPDKKSSKTAQGVRSEGEKGARSTAAVASKGIQGTKGSGTQAGSNPTRRGRPSQKTQETWEWQAIPMQRKLDVLGGFLAICGALFFVSMILAPTDSLLNWWMAALFPLVGWGTYLVPFLFILFGLWLTFRTSERLPVLSGARISGALLIFTNILGWMHLFAGGGWMLVSLRSGGGGIGALIEGLLSGAAGKIGAGVILGAWLIIGVALLVDLSIPDLFNKLRAFFIRRRVSKATQPALPVQLPRQKTPGQGVAEKPSELPSSFRPLRQTDRSVGSQEHNVPAAAPVFEGTNQPAAAPELIQEPVITTSVAQNWSLPKMDAILEEIPVDGAADNSGQDKARLIEETLGAFGAPGHVVDVQRGPSVTLYGVEPDFIEQRNGRTRVRVSKIIALADDLALALASPRIRIQAPVPGRSYVGIEVPNLKISRVLLREILENESFKKNASPLRLALGKDVSGTPVSVDLATMPHLLIAGTTGSGKSVCVNAILSCLLLNNTPADLKLILVDPKRVELTGYNGIPHLLTPVVVDADRVIGALQWMLREMDSRYHKFAKLGVRNIHEYNQKQPARIPYIVVVIDELADLMMLAPDETERSISRLAQLARATGIHLILATQRPSVDVVTGLIKANFPARIAFAVASGIDSRVILDQPGAERLLGKGDMLFQAPDASAPVRLQGVYVSDDEIQRLVETWHLEAEQVNRAAAPAGGDESSLPRGVPLVQTTLWEEPEPREKGDSLLPEAIDLVRREGRASITMLQRRMRIGYTRAARLVDVMEEKGIIGPSLPNSQVREVLDYGNVGPPAEE